MNCPKCNGKLVEIIYGMPSEEMFEKAKKYEIKLGGCEVTIDIEQPKYHCYNCHKSYFKDLNDYIDVEDEAIESNEIPSFLKKDKDK